MFQLRKAADRGHVQHGWLDTWHSFSFGDYYNPAAMGFHTLRVINDDRIAPGAGFGMHGHRDMEILTYVLEGELEHKDSLGHGAVLRPGEVQRMTAGRGIRHSEFNPSPTTPVHLYQIWIMPREPGLEPSYDQRPFPRDQQQGRWRLIAAPDGRDGALTIQQDALLWATNLAPGDEVVAPLRPERAAWLQVLRGTVAAGGHELNAGDALAIENESALSVLAREDAELLLFDLP